MGAKLSVYTVIVKLGLKMLSIMDNWRKVRENLQSRRQMGEE